MGKFRESLTVSSEVYKKQVLRYLAGRDYYLKAGSDVEATFADSILTKKGEEREYWLETKDTAVSLGDSSFLLQLGKYLIEYLSRTPKSRFRMIIACSRIVNSSFFEKTYDRLESETIDGLTRQIAESSEKNARKIISDANPEDVRQFFADTIVIEASLKDLEMAQEKIRPIPPTKPTLPEAEYATKIMTEFGDIAPLNSPDRIFLNLFRLSLPTKIHIGETLYQTADDMFDEKPGVSFPIFDLEDGRIRSFDEFTKENPLSSFISFDSATSVDLTNFVEDEDNERVVVKILNRWIRRRCRKIGLEFDLRSKAYYYPRDAKGDGLVTAKWKPKLKHSTRELTKPMKKDGKINFWVHRGAEISARRYWGDFYIHIRPRFLFSSDGMTLLEGDRADKLDRDFRKSIYSRNLNQLYDVLFWHRHVFPETKDLGTASLDFYCGVDTKQSPKVLEQVTIKSEWKPNIEIAEDIEKLDKIEPTSKSKTLDDYNWE